MFGGCQIRPFEKCIEKVKYTTKVASQDFKETGLYPIISQEEAFISGYWDITEDVFHITKPVVIFGDHSRHLKYVDFDFVIGADGVKILSPVDDINAKYFYYYLKWLDIPSLGYSRHFKSLKEKTVKVFPIEEQQRIVDELDLLSGIIDKKNAQLRDLDALAQSIFYEMFGDPITNNKGWSVRKVIEVVKLQRGYDLPIQDRDSYGSIPIYGSNGIIDRHSEYKAPLGIITGRSGTLGRVYYSEKPFWPLNTTLFSVDCHGNNVVYLKYLLSNYHLERFGAGAGVPTLNRNEFHGQPIISVPVETQLCFAERVSAIESQKALIHRSVEDAQKLFTSRMSHYFD